MLDIFPDRRDQGDDDDGQDNPRKVFRDKSKAPEQIAGAQSDADPQDAPRDVVKGKAAVGHGPDAGQKRGKGADDGQKTRQDDRFIAVFRVEFFGFFQMFRFKETDVAITEHSWGAPGADIIVDSIAQNRGNS